MPSNLRSFSYKRFSKGFTLVELMVSLVVGLLILAAILQVYLITKRNFDLVGGLADRQNAISFVSDVVSTDVRTAYDFSVRPEVDGVVDYTNCSGDIVGDAQDVLHVTYQNNRDNDPYCVNPLYPFLSEVRYFSVIDGDMSEVRYCYSCSNEEGDFQSYPLTASDDPMLLQRRVSLSFTKQDAGILDVDLVLDQSSKFPEEEAGLRELRFRTTVRALVVDTLGSFAE